jgi:hypothetical protein
MNTAEEQYQAYIREGKSVRQAIADAMEAEREACAKIADAVYADEKTWSDSHAATARIIAERIRLRGE